MFRVDCSFGGHFFGQSDWRNLSGTAWWVLHSHHLHNIAPGRAERKAVLELLHCNKFLYDDIKALEWLRLAPQTHRVANSLVDLRTDEVNETLSDCRSNQHGPGNSCNSTCQR